jgi:8-oxo-dGTP pyrophosphatase MutT (NUDIX family)
VELLDAGDARLAPSSDPARSAARLSEAALAPEQEDARDRVMRLLEIHGSALADRGTRPAHLTGSAIVLDAGGSRTLLLLHRKLRRWLQPGGHADGDHELAGVALREATEETGIEGLRVMLPAVDLDIHAVDHGDSLGEHLHLDLRFVVVSPPGAVEQGNHESLDLRWVEPRDLPELCGEEGVVRLLDAGMSALRSLPPGSVHPPSP